ncbi:MAG: erythromycin esterase family protein [Bacteroidetes bacterium]|nr:erythromycin esterase family protein [Bacteroidota bacterium]MBK9541563.1 erythromycin esterase family protein [Bacteroidota bacterium]MBL0258563.1 erythromycin esterase family protein [Bacteroidota bacterium]MBP6402261.1 erythromycin esterase family protein [Bacteroidia bacterium]
MKFLFFILFLAFISCQCFSQVVVQIKGHSDTIYSLHPNETQNIDELIPLEKFFKEKKVIGMGEATHGTKEFFNMKAKMFKFLATYCGYKVFSIEATYGGTLKINDYVLYGKGDVLSAMKGMEFWTWDTEELRDLIEWIKQYNTQKAENDKLKFYGFDCQSFKGASNSLTDYVTAVDSVNINIFKKGISILNDSTASYFSNIDKVGENSKIDLEINQSITFLDTWFTENEHLYIEKSGKQKYLIAKYNIENLKQTLLLFQISMTQNPNPNIRDSCMAQNIKWISELENTKVFVWAHNGHIAKVPYLRTMKIPVYKSMGEYLYGFFDMDYYNIGFVFKEGNFQAIKDNKLQEFHVDANRKHKLADDFFKTNFSSFFVDLRNSSNPIYKRFQKMYEYGAVFLTKPKHLSGIRPKDNFDAIIFVNITQRAIPVIKK